MHGFGRDLRIAVRRLMATPLFTIFAVLSLAVGIGVTTVAYSVVESIFFRKLAIHAPGRAVFVMAPESGRLRFQSVISRPDFDDLRTSQESFSSLAAFWTFNPSLAGPATTELVQAEAITGDYFTTLGVAATLGRTIQAADDEPPAAVAVLSHDVWRGRFASDPRIVGQTVRIGGHPFEIVGVAPRSFAGAAANLGRAGTRVWVPLGTAPRFAPATRWFASPARSGALPRPERERRDLTAVGRLRPGVGVDSAAADLSRLAAGLDASHPNMMPNPGTQVIPRRAWTARTVADVRTEATEHVQRLGIVVAGLVFLVLVVACTNLANLVIARGTTRQQEFAVRRALGATRWRLIREQASESLLIALAGGLAAYVVMRGLAAGLAVDLPLSRSSSMSIQPAVDVPTLVMAVAALLVCLAVFGLEPAIQLTRTRDVRGYLAEGGVGAPTAKRQRMLLRWQVVISTGFFILASLSVRYVFVEVGHDPGVQIDRFAIATLNFYTQGWDETRARRTLDRVVEVAARQPGIESVAVSTGLPLGSYSPAVRLSTPDKPIVAKGTFVGARLVAATPGIFRTIGVPVLRGRGLDDRDRAGAPAIVVVNETAARALFGTSDVVGRQFVMQVTGRGAERPAQTVTVVGIARDTDTSYLSPRREGVVYAPIGQHFDPFITVTARAVGGTAAAVGALQTAIRRADPDVAIEAVGSGRTMLSGPYAFLRFVGQASLSLGLLTLLLAMVGLYGVQSHGVAHRTREIGVRMSFGATAAQIKRMVLKDGYRPVLEGMAIGIFIGLSGRGIIRAYLDAKISILDPWMLAIVPIPLVLAAFCACYLPARRAASVDPNVALRHL